MSSPIDSCCRHCGRTWSRELSLLLLGCTLVLCTAGAGAATFTVNSIADEPDIDQGDGVCLTISSTCTLRAAIMQANFTTDSDIINVPSGTFTLTRVGYDDGAILGDLDIKYPLIIQGAGATLTVIDGNGAATGDRVFEVLDSAADVTLNAMTIRNGNVPTSGVAESSRGGGILADNQSTSSLALHLNNVVIESNNALTGGGLYAVAADVDLNHVALHANAAVDGGAGGGMYLTFGGTLTMHDSVVYGNSAGRGGGLALEGILNASIERTEFYSNTAVDDGGAIQGVLSLAYPQGALTLADSSVHGNSAGSGGGIANQYSLTVLRTTLDANTAGNFGGGIVINGQTNGSSQLIQDSTLSHNTAQFGGGIYYYAGAPSTLSLVSSTISSNTVSHVASTTGSADGGGIYAKGTAPVSLLNATIAANRLVRPVGQTYGTRGGGLFIYADPSNVDTANVTARNSLIGNNYFTNLVSSTSPSDCFGQLHSAGYNLIKNTANTVIDGNTTGNITGQDPVLGPLQDNGGPTLTHALLSGSPAVDKGVNGSLTVLSTSITDSTTAIEVGDASIIPAGGYILIDSEQMVVTNKGGGDSLTVTRHANDTTAASHSVLTAVYLASDQRSAAFARTFDNPNVPNAAGGDGTDIGAFELQDIIFRNGFEL